MTTMTTWVPTTPLLWLGSLGLAAAGTALVLGALALRGLDDALGAAFADLHLADDEELQGQLWGRLRVDADDPR